MKKRYMLFAAIALLLAGCSLTNNGTNSQTKTTNTDIVTTVESKSDVFADGDYETKTEEDVDVNISLNYTSIETDDNTRVTVDNNVATISKKGTYYVSGTLNDGYLVVNVPDTDNVTLVLDNCNITSNSFAGIYFLQGNKLSLQLEGDNYISNVESYVNIDDNNVDGAIYAKDDLCIKGDGSLTVTSTNHGIVAKDDLKVMSGKVTVNATKKGLDVNDSLLISDGTINITSGTDGIHVENTDDSTKGYLYMEDGTLNITSGYDGIDVSSYITILEGDVNIKTGGGSSHSTSSTNSLKGMKAKTNMSLGNVSGTINSADDALHANSSIVLGGVDLELASADDGIHADNTVTINSGTVNIAKSYEGLEAETIVINDGNISIVASDDGINAAGGNDTSSTGGFFGRDSFASSGSGSLTINGGTLIVNSTGDGLDANGSITMTGGTVYVYGPTNNGNGALDYDTAFTITGGTIVAIGSSGMAMNASSATQGSILVNFASSCSANTTVYVKDSQGNVIVEVTSPKAFNSVMVSSQNLKKGETYTISAGSNSTSITLNSYVSGSSSAAMPGQGGAGGMGGFGGRR